MAERIKIIMNPDYGDAIFWDEEGCCIGGCDWLFLDEIIEISLKSIPELKDWFIDWDYESLYHTNNWTDAQWKDWWSKGLKLAKEVKAILPEYVDLFYFSLNEPIWKVRPEDTDDGGLFNYGQPIKIE